MEPSSELRGPGLPTYPYLPTYLPTYLPQPTYLPTCDEDQHVDHWNTVCTAIRAGTLSKGELLISSETKRGASYSVRQYATAMGMGTSRNIRVRVCTHEYITSTSRVASAISRGLILLVHN